MIGSEEIMLQIMLFGYFWIQTMPSSGAFQSGLRPTSAWLSAYPIYPPTHPNTQIWHILLPFNRETPCSKKWFWLRPWVSSSEKVLCEFPWNIIVSRAFFPLTKLEKGFISLSVDLRLLLLLFSPLQNSLKLATSIIMLNLKNWSFLQWNKKTLKLCPFSSELRESVQLALFSP